MEDENDLPVLTEQIYNVDGYKYSRKNEMGSSPMTAGSSNGGLRAKGTFNET
jgi:hypothetical protein